MSPYYQLLRQAAGAWHDAGEARSIALLVLDEAFGVAAVDVYADKVRHFSEEECLRLENIAAALQRGEPVQYALGSARFCDHCFTVTPATLIPRPETEGLVQMALTAARRLASDRRSSAACPSAAPLRVLDAGTGSGCIAISLALALAAEGIAADVEAWDISEGALDVARRNAEALGAAVRFVHADILALPAGASFDLIVSNPPYICQHERAEMASHVTAHEPALALFVPDDDPQRFYRALAALAHRRLISGGALMVEAHSRYADATAAVMREAGLSDVAVHPDIFGLPRFVSGVWSLRGGCVKMQF